MVEQQVATNDLLEQVLGAFGTSDMSSAANWIGLDALVAGPTTFEGAPITLAPNPPAAADEVALVVYNASGTEIQRVPLPVGSDPYHWGGIGSSGSVLPYGTYSFEIESRSNGELLAVDPGLTYTRVTEARVDQGQTMLVLQNGKLVDASAVVGLREPA